jgi:SAM-dependent methyltransferase
MPIATDLIRTDRGPFGLPRGLPGRLAGYLMTINHDQQQELVQVIVLGPAGTLCEIGYGPGVLLRLLAARFPGVALSGADPSAVMYRQARRALRADAARSAPDLRVAAAGDLPFDRDSFDVTISVNNVAFWPDLDAGLRELRRVTRPGGRVLVAWHGGSRPSRIQRQLRLPDGELATIASAMTVHVGDVTRTRLAHSELFAAAVPEPG